MPNKITNDFNLIFKDAHSDWYTVKLLQNSLQIHTCAWAPEGLRITFINIKSNTINHIKLNKNNSLNFKLSFTR